MECYKELASAIVRQACEDYMREAREIKKFSDLEKGREAARKLLVRENKIVIDDDTIEDKRLWMLELAQGRKASIVAFFRGGWYKQLCNIDPDKLMEQLDKKVENGEKIRMTQPKQL